MFIRPCYRRKNGKRHAYWALVESYRTERGPRQRVVAYLGQLKDAERRGVKRTAEGKGKSPYQQLRLFYRDAQPEPEWVEIDTANVRVENQLDFGGPWLALELIRTLQLDGLFESVMPRGEEDIPWAKMAMVLAICRLCNPSSELFIAEHYYQGTAMPEHAANLLRRGIGRHVVIFRGPAEQLVAHAAARPVGLEARRAKLPDHLDRETTLFLRDRVRHDRLLKWMTPSK